MFNKMPLGVSRDLFSQEGASAIVVAVVMSLFVGVAALTIDIGHALVTKNELQNAADSAALAAGRQLGLMYVGWDVEQQKDTTYVLTAADQQPIINAAKNFSQNNSAADLASVALLGNDIEFGTWNFDPPAGTKSTFKQSLVQPNAIRVTARRDSTNGAPNGPISTFFAGVFGVSEMDVRAVSVAALADAGGKAPPGAADAPFGLDRKIFDTNSCGDVINFSPTKDACAGWHTFDDPGANKPTLEGQINGLMADPPTYTSPEVTPHVTKFHFTGGEIDNVFDDLQNLMGAKQEWDPVDSRYEWNVHIPVYDTGTTGPCDNPNKPTTIVGFATASVFYVGTGHGDRDIKAEILCDVFFDAAPIPNPGGGPSLPWLPKTPYPRLVS